MSAASRRWVGRLRRWAARRVRTGGDDGSALVEFLGVTLVLLVPTVYLVLVLGRVQAATFAVEGAAREAARVYVVADDAAQGAERAVTVVGVALRDQGFDDDAAGALALTCSASPCLTPGAEVAASVEVRVPLPFVPAFVGDVLPLEVPVSAQRVAPVDAYRVAR
ncbi:pilus assembly protein [Cellulomonas sp. HD19AZ1]|uniref:pilus assembly protein n=1 Tax=Cellulomonas sp. HD19AZ1 TaxID=2559593 RepID=UPI0035131D83